MTSSNSNHQLNRRPILHAHTPTHACAHTHTQLTHTGMPSSPAATPFLLKQPHSYIQDTLHFWQAKQQNLHDTHMHTDAIISCNQTFPLRASPLQQVSRRPVVALQVINQNFLSLPRTHSKTCNTSLYTNTKGLSRQLAVWLGDSTCGTEWTGGLSIQHRSLNTGSAVGCSKMLKQPPNYIQCTLHLWQQPQLPRKTVKQVKMVTTYLQV